MTDSEPELGPSASGRWVVTTEHGTRHVFDVDRMLCTRALGSQVSGASAHDGSAMALTRVAR